MMLVFLALAPIRVERIGIGKDALVPIVSQNWAPQYYRPLVKSHREKTVSRFTNAIEIDKGMHAQPFVDRISDACAISL